MPSRNVSEIDTFQDYYSTQKWLNHQINATTVVYSDNIVQQVINQHKQASEKKKGMVVVAWHCGEQVARIDPRCILLC